LKAERGGIERDPEDDEEGLPDDELRGAEEPREALRHHAETVVAERSVVGKAMGLVRRQDVCASSHEAHEIEIFGVQLAAAFCRR
jgi:hypothetical protein